MNKPTRRTFLEALATVSALSNLPAVEAAEAFEPGPLKLWYRQPAAKWEEAIPVGNGRLGAMIFGNVTNERLQLNEITVWSGKLEPHPDRLEAYKSLEPIRQLIRQGKYDEAAKEITAERTCLDGGWAAVGTYGSYQTLGDLNIDFPAPKDAISQYVRWLNLDSATAGVSYRMGQDTWTREIFSSAVDQVLVMRFACSRKGAVNFKLRLSRLQFATTSQTSSDVLSMTGTSLGQPDDLKYEAQVKVINTGGTVSGSGNELQVEDADSAIILLAAGTDYLPDYEKAFKGPGPHVAVTRTLTVAATRDFDSLKRDHVRDYKRYFQRVSLSFSSGDTAALPQPGALKYA